MNLRIEREICYTLQINIQFFLVKILRNIQKGELTFGTCFVIFQQNANQKYGSSYIGGLHCKLVSLSREIKLY